MRLTKMKRNILAFAFALGLASAAQAVTYPAYQAVNATTTAAGTNGFISLGPAPIQVEVTGPYAVNFVIADSFPPAGTQGLILGKTGGTPLQTIYATDGSSNVYVSMAANAASGLIYSPIFGGSGGTTTSNAGTGWTTSGLATAALQNAFGPPVQGTPLVMTGGGGQATQSLPAGLSVKAINVGANPAWCQTGSSYTGITSGHYLAGAGSTWAFTPGAATALACQSVTGSTTVNTEGGGGPAVDTGGGGGGSSLTNYALETGGNLASILNALNTVNTNLGTLNTTAGNPLATQANSISVGGVGILAPLGTTNIAGSVAVTASTGALVDLYSATAPTPYAGSGAAANITELEAIRQNSAGRYIRRN